MVWLYALGAVAFAVAGFFASSVLQRRRETADVLKRGRDTRPAEDAAAAGEEAKGAARASEVLRASPPDLALRVDELRRIGRGEKPPGDGPSE